MKQVKLEVPTKTVLGAGVLPDRFFKHNSRLDILRVFAVAQRTAILIAEIHRDGPLYSAEEIAEMTKSLESRYNLEHFEIIDVDAERKVYTVLLRARIPEVLQAAWNTVGTEAFLDGPIQISRENVHISFVLMGKATTPFELLDSFSVPYEVKEVRRGPPETDQDGLTREQRALLRMALEMGYYEVPARVTLTHLARYTGVSKAAVSKRLRRAERRVLTGWLGTG